MLRCKYFTPLWLPCCSRLLIPVFAESLIRVDGGGNHVRGEKYLTEPKVNIILISRELGGRKRRKKTFNVIFCGMLKRNSFDKIKAVWIEIFLTMVEYNSRKIQKEGKNTVFTDFFYSNVLLSIHHFAITIEEVLIVIIMWNIHCVFHQKIYVFKVFRYQRLRAINLVDIGIFT